MTGVKIFFMLAVFSSPLSVGDKERERASNNYLLHNRRKSS